jgi:predicted metal-dependent phosphoesterase TrpH
MAAPAPAEVADARRAFVDLHCHTSTSFDSLADPAAVARAAAARGITHLAVTDHDRIEGALRARDAAPPGLTVIVGEEIKTANGDVLGIFLSREIPPGLSAVETIAAIREQGGLVGIPHPFDGMRGFGRKSGATLESIADRIDWIESYNARVVGGHANQKAPEFALAHGLPGLAASDSHTVMEVGLAYNIVRGDPGTPEGMLASLAGVEIVPGRATVYVRAWTPIAKMIQSMRGNGRRRTPDSTGESR